MFKNRKKQKNLVDLLFEKSTKPELNDINKTQKAIKKTFDRFGLKAGMGDVHIGPIATSFIFSPEDGNQWSKFQGIVNDIALDLSAYPIRMELPIPGSVDGVIEVPNENPATVPLVALFRDKKFDINSGDLVVPFGVGATGEVEFIDFATLPHLLVAGATNSGKTMFLHSLIVSLMCKFDPDELKFILADTKRVEMKSFEGLPYLLTPINVEIRQIFKSLKWITAELDRRFEILSSASKSNIVAYNEKSREKLPYIFFIIDVTADIMVSEYKKEAEEILINLFRMGRTVGIHVVLTTSRPCDDVYSPMLRANCPARLAFSVASLKDSKAILDMRGAEKLLGKGDALFYSADTPSPVRLRTPYVSDGEIERVVDYIMKNN